MKKFLIGFILIALVTSAVIYKLYNKPHRDPTKEKSIQIKATELFQNFERNETDANDLYLDKVVEVSGKIIEITTNQENFPVMVLETDNPMFAVRCTMEKTDASARVGDTVIIKGICTGYLSDVIIVKATLVE